MSIWRSVMAARASLSRHSFSNHTLPSSHALITHFLHSTPLFPLQIPTTPRFLSHAPDSPEFAADNGALPEDNLGNDLSEVNLVAGDAEYQATDEEKLAEIAADNGGLPEVNLVAGDAEYQATDEEKLAQVLSLLESSSGEESIESSLDAMDLNLNEEFVVRVLESKLKSQSLVSFATWAFRVKETDFEVTSHVVDSLVVAVCNGSLGKRVAYSLWDLLKEVRESVADVFGVGGLNKLIALLSKLGEGDVAAEVFEKFGEFGVAPNADSYYFTIEALCRVSMYDRAWSFCEKMIEEEVVPDGDKVGKILSWLCKGKKAKEAHLVYVLAKEKNQFPPRFSANFLITSLCREADTVRLALEMLDDFDSAQRKCAIKIFSAVVRGLCRIKETSEAEKLLRKMIADGPPPGNAVFNLVVQGHSKAGEMEEAVETVKLMKKRGLKPDVYTYTALVSGYANGGQMEEACKVLAEAQKKHSKLSSVTYHSVIRGYCKLEAFDKALVVLSDMESHGIQANADEYNKLIQSLCLKALDWETAEKLHEEMKEKGLHLNGITRGLVRAVKEMVHEEVETTKI